MLSSKQLLPVRARPLVHRSLTHASTHATCVYYISSERTQVNRRAQLEKIALSDEYFIKRKLYPNVDFYTGIAYRLIGIPMDMYTVMFAMARTVGWMTQWKEFMIDDYKKVVRPRQMYVGEVERPFVKKEDREEISRLPKVNKVAGLMNLPIL